MDILAAVQKLLDYECYNLKNWYNLGGETQHIYQSQHNMLIDLKEKLTAENLPQYLKWDGSVAKDKIYEKDLSSQ